MTHRIATMDDPLERGGPSAILVAVHTAREYLSIAERLASHEGIQFSEVRSHLRGADNLLRSAVTLCTEVNASETRRAVVLLHRAQRATMAAYYQCQIALSYARAKSPSAFETKQGDKTRGILRRAAEAAKQEAHRALAELAEKFPDAVIED